MRARQKGETIRRVVYVLLGILGLVPGVAAEPEAIRIDYGAPAGCPDASAFMRSLRGRTTRFRLAPPDEPARSFSVRVSAGTTLYTGRLEIRRLDGGTAVRTVDAAVCDDLTAALALVTALAIDPDALGGGRRTNPDIADEPMRASPGDQKREDAEVREAGETGLAAPAEEDGSARWRWSAGLLGRLTMGASPRVGYGGDLLIETEAPAASRLGPSARAGLAFGQSDLDLASPAGAGARFRWALAMLEGCPVRLPLVLRLALHPCLSFRMGALSAEGKGISQPQRAVGLWADLGPAVRVRATVSDHLTVEMQGALIVPLTRPTFQILDVGSGTQTTAHSVPSVGGTVGIGATYGFR